MTTKDEVRSTVETLRTKRALKLALEALERANNTAMIFALKARIPECGEFAAIAQDLDWAITALRARLSDGDKLSPTANLTQDS